MREPPLPLSHVCVSHMCGDEGDEVGRSGFVMEPERLSPASVGALSPRSPIRPIFETLTAASMQLPASCSEHSSMRAEFWARRPPAAR